MKLDSISGKIAQHIAEEYDFTDELVRIHQTCFLVRLLRLLVRCDLFLTEKVRHKRNKLKLKGVLENRFVN